MSKRLMSFTILLSLAILAAILIISGCSSNTPTSPSANTPSDLTKLIPISLEPIEATKIISPTKTDTIQIVRNTSIDKYIVPAGALSAATNIDVKEYGDKIRESKVLVFEFGPDGLVFNSATHLNVDITKLNATARTANLYYFDPSVNDWVYQGTIAVDHGRVDFSIYHFSKYAIE
jgi:hypothetical protein